MKTFKNFKRILDGTIDEKNSESLDASLFSSFFLLCFQIDRSYFVFEWTISVSQRKKMIDHCFLCLLRDTLKHRGSFLVAIELIYFSSRSNQEKQSQTDFIHFK